MFFLLSTIYEREAYSQMPLLPPLEYENWFLLYLKNQEYGTSTSAFISFLLTSITQLKFPFSPFPPPPSSEFATRELFNKAILELMVSYFLEFRFLKRELEKAFIDSVNISFSYFAPWLLTYSFPSRDSFTIPMIG